MAILLLLEIFFIFLINFSLSEHPCDGAAEGAECDDGNPCTVNNKCFRGFCVGEMCPDDGYDCTEEICDKHAIGGCTRITHDYLCDDGKGCTTDICTLDGCKHIPNNGLCTADEIDKCSYFECLPDDIASDADTGCQKVGKLFCDDGNDCTEDYCNRRTGCQHHERECSGVENECTHPICDPISGACIPITSDYLCDDRKSCTIDTCSSELGCIHTPYDGLCTESNQCEFFECLPDDPASDNETGCKQVGELNCNDIDLCTTFDGCFPNEGCVYGRTRCRDDGNICTERGICDENTGDCIYIAQDYLCDDGLSCTTDICDPDNPIAQDGCVHIPNNGLCTSGFDKCSCFECLPDDDLSDNGTGCQYIGKLNCDDDNLCTTDSCDPLKGCVYQHKNCEDHYECTDNICNEMNGNCVTIKVNERCNDNDECTKDFCDPLNPAADNRGCVNQKPAIDSSYTRRRLPAKRGKPYHSSSSDNHQVEIKFAWSKSKSSSSSSSKRKSNSQYAYPWWCQGDSEYETHSTEEGVFCGTVTNGDCRGLKCPGWVCPDDDSICIGCSCDSNCYYYAGMGGCMNYRGEDKCTSNQYQYAFITPINKMNDILPSSLSLSNINTFYALIGILIINILFIFCYCLMKIKKSNQYQTKLIHSDGYGSSTEIAVQNDNQ